MTTGFLYDPRYLDHDTGPGHPERSDRLLVTMDFLERQVWFGNLVRIAPRRADREWIETIHAPSYVARAELACQQESPYLDVLDVSISRDSYDVALLAAGGVLALADSLIKGEIDTGFALIRPPGHHAEQSMALGFCLFNNVAILTRYLQRRYGLDKILILDWDVHHGNGTQHSFESDPSVLYVSLHQYPFYPGTGSSSEAGTGAGHGATLNCPMSSGAGDADYREAFVDKILPKVNAFEPEVVLISAGFDAHHEDPLANINLSTEFFGWMTACMLDVADRCAEGRLLSLLEGGYSLSALPRCISEHLLVLSRTNA